MVSHLAAVRLHGEVRAGAHRQPVDQHGARAADLDVAGALGARQAEAVAQHVEQQLLGLDLERAWARPLRRGSMRISAVGHRASGRAGRGRRAAPRRPSSRRGRPPGTSAAAAARRRRGRSAAAGPSAAAMAWKRMARSRASAVSTAQRTSSPAMTTPWLRSSAARRRPSAAATRVGPGAASVTSAGPRRTTPGRRRTGPRRGSACAAARRWSPAPCRRAGGRG